MAFHVPLIERDLQHIWHPLAQMKDYSTFKPVEVVGAQGSCLELRDGKKVIDGISSWWCKSLGHNHPYLKAALNQQLEKFEHVMLGHTTNTVIVELSEKLTSLAPTLNKVFYASDGSCAVEVALKMSLHVRSLQGEPERNQFIALENAYHGDTIGALSVSDIGIYRDPYAALLFKTRLISALPYVTGTDDPLWHDCQTYWEPIEAVLAAHVETTTAVIIEPIVQGAAGMKIISQDFFKRLRCWTQTHAIHLIADEIMTGIGRTGQMLACQHAGIEPDFLCLGKGLTSGWLPLSATLTSESIYAVFYDDYATGKSFLHSHTFSGNALAASVAIATLEVIESEQLCARANDIGFIMQKYMSEIKSKTEKLDNIRSIGAIVAADIVCQDQSRRIGFEFYQAAMKLGAIIRPIGRVLYWLPPLNIDEEDLFQLKAITERALACL